MRFFTATVLLGISKAALPSGQGTALVRLQSTTPGSSQSGHVNVSGTGLFGTLSATANLTTSLSGVVSGSNTSVTGGGAGVAGATASAFGYGVYGAATNATSGTAGYFRALGTNGIALSGDAPATTGANYGGYFTSSGSSGYGVYGRNFSTTGPTFGVAGQSFSPSGIGVYGSNSGGGWSGYFVGNTYVGGSLGLGTTAPSAKLDIVGTAKMSGFQLTTSPAAGAVLTSNASGIGTWQALPPSSWTVSGSNIFSANAGNVGVGTAAPDSKVHALTASGNGVHGVTSSPSDSGVWGQNTGSGYGVSGVTNSASATGVWGHNNGSGKGVWGSAGTGYGVYGTATGLQGRGVYGYSDNAAGSGIGVYGFSSGLYGTGVFGYVNGTGGSCVAVNGWCDSPNGWAGLFTGNVKISGKLGVSTSDPSLTLAIGDTDSGVNAGGDGVLSFVGNNQQTLDLRDGFARFGREMNASVGIGFGGGGTGEQITSDRWSGGSNAYGLDFRVGAGGAARMSITNGGNVGIGTQSPDSKFRVIGTAKVDVLEIAGGADVAERFVVRGQPEPGQVVEIDPDHPGDLRVCTQPGSKLVAGVVSGANGLAAGMVLTPHGSALNRHAVALTGKVWVHCIATKDISPGDFLVSSEERGLATTTIGSARDSGAVIGKAMTRLAAGKRGLVLTLVSLQ